MVDCGPGAAHGVRPTRAAGLCHGCGAVWWWSRPGGMKRWFQQVLALPWWCRCSAFVLSCCVGLAPRLAVPGGTIPCIDGGSPSHPVSGGCNAGFFFFFFLFWVQIPPGTHVLVEEFQTLTGRPCDMWRMVPGASEPGETCARAPITAPSVITFGGVSSAGSRSWDGTGG